MSGSMISALTPEKYRRSGAGLPRQRRADGRNDRRPGRDRQAFNRRIAL
jgi:hypothetical protein